MFEGRNRIRYFVILGVMALFFVAAVWRLTQLQIVQGNEFREQSERRFIRTLPITAPRGEILDRHGRPLVTNRPGFFVRFHRLDVPRNERDWANDQLNMSINNILQIAREANIPYTTTFPISGPPFMFDFRDEDIEIENQQRQTWLSQNNLNALLTADEVIDHFRRRYRISEEYTPEELRDIISIRFEMEQRHFSLTAPFTFAADVDMSVVQIIRERTMDLPGVVVDIEPIREYANGSLAAHTLGRVAPITQEEFARLREYGYGLNDLVGRDGMERVLERHLRGTDGHRSVEQTRAGVTAQILEVRPPVNGHYAILTLDLRVQEAAERALEQTMQQLRNDSRWDSRRRGANAYSGAAVAVCVNTGQVLALATWPTYDPSNFNELFEEMRVDPLRPMLNRALQGTYAPGSTYKMVPALAALEEGIIPTNGRVWCGGAYFNPALGNFQPRCMGVHGSLDVAQALSVSCNVFFYNVGWRTGIDRMTHYARQLGFGELTGIELDERRGVLASPAHTESQGRAWMAGNTVQAAIGQTYHNFTPVQLANFMATIANGGTRYRLHLTKEIRDSVTNEIIERTEPEIKQIVDMSEESHRVIMQGMRQATVTGTARGAFAGFPIATGGKTGTAQTGGHSNGLFVGFAPFDNPQIAVAVVIEDGVGGSRVAPVAREMFAAYFGLNEESEDVAFLPRNTLIR